MEANKTGLNIALLASNLLGDSIVNLTLAHNLSLNGFKVTYYSNPISSMQGWLSNIIVKAYPLPQNFESEFSKYDFILADPRPILGKRKQENINYSELHEYIKQYAFIGFTNDNFQIKSNLSIELKEKCKRLLKFSKIKLKVLDQGDEKSIPQRICDNCKEILKFNIIQKATGFKPPIGKNLILQKNNKKILIHPFSSTLRHNWPIRKFIKLANRLAAEDWQVVFISSPVEHSKLLEYIGTKFESPVFQKISELSEYMFESKALIGNDSGNVHLASALGIETLVISHKGENYTWRPGFKDATIVRPPFILNIGGNRIWKPLIPVKKVYEAFCQMVHKAN